MNDKDLIRFRQIIDQLSEQIAQNADVIMDIADRGQFEHWYEKALASQTMKLAIALLKIQHEETKRIGKEDFDTPSER